MADEEDYDCWGYEEGYFDKEDYERDRLERLLYDREQPSTNDSEPLYSKARGSRSVNSSSLKRRLVSIVCLVLYTFAVYLTLDYGYDFGIGPIPSSLFDDPNMQGPNFPISPLEFKIGTIIVMLIWGLVFLPVWYLWRGPRYREDGTWNGIGD